ncbi:MAG: serine/threonine-protein kinase [Verrucomicrobiota bacterium]
MESAGQPPSSTTPAPDWLRDLGWADVYEIRRIIGRGGMGRVYEGWHRQLGIAVALKIIDPHLVGEDHVRARFEKEAMTLARLQEPVPHPNIVRVLDFKLLDSVGCIVMAYVKGMDVRAWCVDRAESQTKRVALVEQVARAAGYFHSFGLVHRDLKPANVLVREGSGEPVIVDFGIVRGREDVTLTRTQQALGTAAYMAPELLGLKKNEPVTQSTTEETDQTPPGEISPAADVYALGVMLYELMCGSLPYGATLVEVLPKHQRETVPSGITSRPKRLPKDLERVCLKAIAHRRSERYANGTEFAEDLARYLRGESVLARPISKIRHAARRAKRRPALTLATILVAVLILVAGARLLWDARLAKVARLREQISLNIPIASWSTEVMLRTDQLIDELQHKDPVQAAIFHRTLIHGAMREILQMLKRPRISEQDRQEIQVTLNWLEDHDKTEAARLRAAVEQRQARWDALLEMAPPFQNLAAQADNAQVVEGAVVLSGQSTGERLLKFTRPPPLEITSTFVIPPEGAKALGFKVRISGEWHTLQLIRPPTSSLVLHLRQFHLTNSIPEAALVIARKDRILAVTPIETPPEPGTTLQMKLHIENRHISLETSAGDRVESLQRYQSVDPVSVSLVGLPSLRIQNLLWTGPDELPDASPLEKGDLDAAKEQWWPAETHFLQLSGDPEYGAEALFKAGDCQFQLGRMADAQSTWEQVMRGPESEWRTEACLQLWYLHADAGRLDQARVYLDQLPGPENMPADYLAQIQRPGRRLDDIYRSQGRGLNLLRPMPGVEDAVRVHRMLKYTPVEVAARFALARHFNGMDEAARDLLYDGVKVKRVEKITSEEKRSLSTNLELWSLITRSEIDEGLAAAQKTWLAHLPATHSIALTIRLDHARRLAREGRAAEALVIARQVLMEENAPIMGFTGAALLIAALDPDTGVEAANQALQRVAQAPRQIHEFTLIHRWLLHSVARDWTTQSTVDVLAQFLSLGESRESRETLRGRICRLLLEDDAMVNSLNHLFDDQAGQKLLRSFALRSQPARPSVHELFYMVLRRHIIFSAFGPGANDQELAAAFTLTTSWLDAYAKGKITADDFLALMESLQASEPGLMLKAALPRWPGPLQEAVGRVFEMRRPRP